MRIRGIAFQLEILEVECDRRESDRENRELWARYPGFLTLVVNLGHALIVILVTDAPRQALANSLP
jgi:hypothetical protein